VTLAGASLSGTRLSTFVPPVGTQFTIIDNDGSDPISARSRKAPPW